VNRIETLQNLIRKICLKFIEGAIKLLCYLRKKQEWDITLLVQNNFIRCYWTKTWNWKSFKEVKVTLKKLVKRLNYTLVGTGFVAFLYPRAKRVLEMAVHEGKDLGQNFVGTEHILLALIESDGVAMRTLDKLNVDIHMNLILTYIEETQEEILRPLHRLKNSC
jgi:ATP-dependent Clp protease ATP-binding subunit ClpA